MDNLFTLDVECHTTLDEFVESKEFLEFGYTLKMLDDLYEDAFTFTEAVKDNTIDSKFGRAKQATSGIVKNTKDTTKDVAGAFNQITDANATLIKNTWDLTMGGIRLIVKMSSFVIKNIAKIPGFVVNTGKKVSNVGQKIKNKIQGNISLYITADDVQALFNQSLVDRLGKFIGYAAELTKGDTWNMTLGLHKSNGLLPVKFSRHDIDLSEKMNDVFKGMEHLEFSPTTIPMKNQAIVELYFGEGKIKYTLNSKTYESTYYDALATLMELLGKRRSEIEQIQNSINVKIDSANAGVSGFSNLSSSDQDIIKRAVRQIAKVTGVVGKISNYIIKDMKTIQDSVEKVSKMAANANNTEDQNK